MVNHEARRLLDIGEDGVGRPVSELGLPWSSDRSDLPVLDAPRLHSAGDRGNCALGLMRAGPRRAARDGAL